MRLARYQGSRAAARRRQDDGGGRRVVFVSAGRPKGGLMECRRVKRATSRNGAGRFGLTVLVPLLGVSGEASAMLVYSYYSDQIIITTDERRTGPVDLPPEVGPSIAACWRPPHKGDQV